MKKLLLIAVAVFGLRVAHGQTVTGIYIKDNFKAKKLAGSIDSLILNNDSTCSQGFYYPAMNKKEESMVGKWKISNGKLILYYNEKPYAEYKIISDSGEIKKLIPLNGILYSPILSLEKKYELDKR